MFSRETELIETLYIYINYRDYSSCNYGDWKSHSLLSASAGEPGSWWNNSLWVLRPKNQELWCRRAEDGCPSLRSKEGNLPLFTFLFYLGPQRIEWCLPTLVRLDLFTQSTDSNIFSRNTLTGISRCFISYTFFFYVRYVFFLEFWQQLSISNVVEKSETVLITEPLYLIVLSFWKLLKSSLYLQASEIS